MERIQSVEDNDIFIKTNSLTNLIKSKKMRKILHDNNIKVEIAKEHIPVTVALGNVFTTTQIVFNIQHPSNIGKETLNRIVDELSNIIYRKYDNGQIYKYI